MDRCGTISFPCKPYHIGYTESTQKDYTMSAIIEQLVTTILTYEYSMLLFAAAAVLVCLYYLRKYFAGGMCTSKARLDGKTVIITGANTGIGLETAVDLAGRGARVILACRSSEKGEKAAVEVRRRSGNDNVVFRSLDLSSLESVRRFASQVLNEEPLIDILINNAGVMGCPYAKTVDGFEMQFGVNHLGPFLLTNLLLDRLKDSPAARIVTVSALAAVWGKIDFDNINWDHSYNHLNAYMASKLANIVFTRSLAKRLTGSRVTANALHPGVIGTTELGRHHPFIVSALFHVIIIYRTTHLLHTCAVHHLKYPLLLLVFWIIMCTSFVCMQIQVSLIMVPL